MKKLFFSLIAVVCCMSMSAQTMNVYKDGNVVKEYTKLEMDSVVFVEAETPSPSGSHEYIDLGLPSGTLWATCNIGASKPEEYGYYYAWGETTPQSNNSYNWENYKWCNGTNKTLIKYNTSATYGIVDNKKVLESADDAATANWGNDWCMPTHLQQMELFNSEYTTVTWTTQNGVKGSLITSKMEGYTDKSIFLPAAGSYSDGSLTNAGSNGTYWSSMINSIDVDMAWHMRFFITNINASATSARRYGASVRAVRVQGHTGVLITTPDRQTVNNREGKKYLSRGKFIIEKEDKLYNATGIEIK